MPTLSQLLRDFAWASQAAYLDFTGLSRSTPRDQISARLQSSALAPHNRFSETQADLFLGIQGSAGYAFQHQTPNDSYGFSASVFKSSSANEYTIAIRGTEFEPISQFISTATDLLDADFIGVVLQGAAKKQLFSAYRYYKQLITPEGQQVRYSVQEQTLLAE